MQVAPNIPHTRPELLQVPRQVPQQPCRHFYEVAFALANNLRSHPPMAAGGNSWVSDHLGPAHGHFALHIVAHSAFRRLEKVSKFVVGEQMPS